MQLLPEESTRASSRSAPEACAQRLLDVVPPIVRVIRKFMWSNRMQGLSVPQFRAMALLNFSPRASLSCVANYVGSSLPAASRMIDGLVAKKLVLRQECCDDRRQISLALTPRGASAFRESRQAARDQLAQRLSGLEPAQQQMVMDSMECLAGIFGSDANVVRGGAVDPCGKMHVPDAQAEDRRPIAKKKRAAGRAVPNQTHA